MADNGKSQEEIRQYNTFRWVKVDGSNSGFQGQRSMLSKALHLSSLGIREICRLDQGCGRKMPYEWELAASSIWNY